MDERGTDLFLLENRLWLLTKQLQSPAYDFAFDSVFACRRPWQRPESVTAIARMGAPIDYPQAYHYWKNVACVGSIPPHKMTMPVSWISGIRCYLT